MKHNDIRNNFPVIIRDEPYPGYIQTSVLDRDGLIMNYTQTGDIVTFKEFQEITKGKFKLVTWEEVGRLNAEFINSLITEPVEITEEEYDELLNVMPPQRWGSYDGVTMFHQLEKITGDLVTWAASYYNKYYKFDDVCYKDLCLLSSKVREVYKEKYYAKHLR